MNDPERVSETGHFWRPSPHFNRWLERGFGRLRVRALSADFVTSLQRRCEQDIADMGGDRDVLTRVVTDSPWRFSPGRAPTDAWGGEVLRRRGGQTPEVLFYRDSALTRLPTRWIFETAAQLAVDHMYGHLYPYYAGEDDWGEEVACLWQYRLLRHRGGMRNRMLALIVKFTHRVHKQIPLSNYRP